MRKEFENTRKGIDLNFFSKNRNAAEGQLGICLETAGISLARVRRNKEGLPILKGYQWIAAESGDQQQGLEREINQRQLQGANCIAVLGDDSHQLLQVEMADLPVEEKRDAARWQIRDLLNYPADEAVVDLYDVAPFSGDRKPLTYVVAAREKLLRQRAELLTSSGLQIAAIDIPEFALRNLADLFAEESHGVAILLLLEDDGLLVIAREGTLYLTRSLSLGMNALLAHADGDYEALVEQLDPIVLEIQRSFDFCESTFHLPIVSRLLVAQTQREIPALIRYLGDFLATRVEALNFSGVLEVPEGSEQLDLNRHLLAIGGALRQEGP